MAQQEQDAIVFNTDKSNLKFSLPRPRISTTSDFIQSGINQACAAMALSLAEEDQSTSIFV